MYFWIIILERDTKRAMFSILSSIEYLKTLFQIRLLLLIHGYNCYNKQEIAYITIPENYKYYNKRYDKYCNLKLTITFIYSYLMTQKLFYGILMILLQLYTEDETSSSMYNNIFYLQYCATFSLLKYKLGLILCNLVFLEFFWNFRLWSFFTFIL